MNWKDYRKLAKMNLKTRRMKSGFQTAFIVIGLLVIVLVNLGIGFLKNINDIYDNVSQKGLMIHVVNMLDEQDETKNYRKLLEYQKKDNRIVYIDANEDTLGMDIQGIEGCDNTWVTEETRVNLTNEKKYLKEFVIGKMDLSEDEIILPKYIFRTINDAQDEYGTVEYLDCEQYIGKTITIWVPTWIYTMTSVYKQGGSTYQFKIVGVYDNVKQCTSGDEAYINRNKQKKMVENSVVYAEGVDKSSFAVPEESYVVVVKKHKDVEAVAEELKKLEAGVVTPQYYGGEEVEQTMQFIVLAGDAIGILILLWASITMMLSYLKDIRNRTSEYGLLKAVGYREKDLSGILWMETCIIELRAIIIALLTGEALVLLLNYLIATKGNILWKYLHAGYEWWQILLVVFVGMAVPSIAYAAGIKKIRKIEPIVALKSRE